jgi:hypothetical protein
MRRGAAAVAGTIVVALTLGLVACGGDSDGRSDYVDALADAAKTENEATPAATRRCLAEAAVDAVGVDKLKEAASPDEIRDAGTTELALIGVKVTEADGEDFYERYNDCVDVREALIVGAVGSADISPDATACLQTELSDDLIRRYVVKAFTEGTNAALDDAALVGEIEAAFTACTATPEP